jgi:nucleotide-binding universal stress UspA family protein
MSPILLAVDGTPASDRAIALLARHRADPAAIRVVVLNVQALPPVMWPEGALDVPFVESALRASGEKLAEEAAAPLRASGLRVEARVRIGVGAEAILQEAQSSGASLIVLGTRGHGTLCGFAGLGRPSYRVAAPNRRPIRPVSAIAAAPQNATRALALGHGAPPS